MTDVCVVGGGPAGLATALCCVRRGLSAVVVEPREGPLDKACGEGLMPAAAAALDELVGPDRLGGVPLRGIRYRDGCGHEVVARFGRGEGRGVRRPELHAVLAEAAATAGVPRIGGRVTRVEQDGSGVRAAGVTARYLVAADGLHSPVRALLGLDRPDRHPARYGVRRHYPVEPWTDCVEVHWGPRAEAYVTPVGPRLVGVAVLSSDRQPFEAHLEQFPGLVGRLPVEPVGRALGAGPLRQRVAARRAGRVLLVGDAAGYVDALTGEGLAIALESARVAADCIATDRPDAYDRRWRQASRRSRLLTETLLRVARGRWTRTAVVPASQRLPRVFAAAVDQLAGAGAATESERSRT